MFIRSSYWHTWSRILGGEEGWVVELDITPVNGFTSLENIQQIENETIRCHCTPRSERDKICTELPEDIQQVVSRYVGAEKLKKLLSYDYMKELDMSPIHMARARMRCGGNPFTDWLNLKKK